MFESQEVMDMNEIIINGSYVIIINIIIINISIYNYYSTYKICSNNNKYKYL